jgi:hypothetical protein
VVPLQGGSADLFAPVCGRREIAVDRNISLRLKAKSKRLEFGRGDGAQPRGNWGRKPFDADFLRDAALLQRMSHNASQVI